ncbi:AfsR/SARP family transcriptional regulator [Streptomyces sp. NPDC007369]|uniref:AfsR/SARP family transcriptional regulator n=1 Tax=Streptomyces sp. NPDC007369 TaxID=3154589 RepID=UPI0033E4DBF3
MLIHLLGPVAISQGGAPPQPLRSARERHLLALLAWTPNTYMSDGQVIEEMWEEDRLPARPRDTLYTHASRLRRLLRPNGPGGGYDAECCLVRRDGGYVLAVDPDVIDLHRARRLCAEAHALVRTGQREAALLLFEDALAPAAGTPLADLGSPWAARARWSAERDLIAARLGHARLALELGRHAEAVPVLSRLADRHPLDEGIAEMLMRALCLSGRPAEALTCFHTLRKALVDALGQGPAGPVAELYEQLLRLPGSSPPRTPGTPRSSLHPPSRSSAATATGPGKSGDRSGRHSGAVRGTPVPPPTERTSP